ncbi:PAS domain-containing sensor histidine kinase [Janthinobacterium fluminis]|uniref:PAS domain-containing sensor histidine kinase n=1 Tax=Janthinobacterium fluminis TaxID=2987524 RepID=A0ABT5JZU1_9BURK|nr:PAS domain-containing sensor histidine kinase [Janthinobacterium fluminis]MDC8757678.1 PAS domain-containing sensor histidine kinase [Janthinobacterium fluminis]
MSQPDHFSLHFAAPLLALTLLLTLPLAWLLLMPAYARAARRGGKGFGHAGDATIRTDAAQTILEANPAAAAMFGTSVAAMRGAALDKFIPRDLRTLGQQQTVGHFGDTGVNLRMMGRRAVDHAVSGLKANGARFPLEGTIASVDEDGQTVYTIVLRDITARKQVHEQLERSFSQLRQLSATLQSIREEERKHIARELHDDLGQLLATLRLDLTLLGKLAGAAPANARILDNMDGLIVTAITSLRRIASNLRPRALDEGGLYFALQSLRQDFIQRHPVNVELLADETELTLDDAYSTVIYRIVQESLTNIARHAEARNVTVALHRVDSELAIEIQDDGRGIEDSDMDKATSFGLLGMRERVWGLHGTISIGANEGGAGGTRIDIALPLPAERT